MNSFLVSREWRLLIVIPALALLFALAPEYASSQSTQKRDQRFDRFEVVFSTFGRNPTPPEEGPGQAANEIKGTVPAAGQQNVPPNGSANAQGTPPVTGNEETATTGGSPSSEPNTPIEETAASLPEVGESQSAQVGGDAERTAKVPGGFRAWWLLTIPSLLFLTAAILFARARTRRQGRTRDDHVGERSTENLDDAVEENSFITPALSRGPLASQEPMPEASPDTAALAVQTSKSQTELDGPTKISLQNAAAELARQRVEIEEARQRLEEERLAFQKLKQTIQEEEQEHLLRKTEEERLRAEQEALRKEATELARQRAEVEQARARIEDEKRSLRELEERLQAEKAELGLLEEQSQPQLKDELQRLEERWRQVDGEPQRPEVEAQRRVEQEAARLVELEELKNKADEQARQQTERERQIRAEIDSATQEQQQRIEAEMKRRQEAEARLRDEGVRLQREAAALARSEAEAKGLGEAILANGEEHLRAQEAVASAQESQSPNLEGDTANEVVAEAVAAVVVDEDEALTETLWKSIEVGKREVEYVLPVAAEPVPEATSSSQDPVKDIDVVEAEKAIAQVHDDSAIPQELLEKLTSEDPAHRAAALMEVAQLGNEDAFRQVTDAFEDSVPEVRNAAALALYGFQPDRAASFTRALRVGSPERRRLIGASLASSGLANDAIGHLTGKSREKTYDAFSLLFLMAKAGEVQPLMEAIEEYPNIEVRLAVVKLLALSGQTEVVPAFRRLAVRGSLPAEVRSAVMEAIYQLTSQSRETAPSVA